MWRDPGAPADSFYETRPECTDIPKSRFRIKVVFSLSFICVHYWRKIMLI